MIRNLPANLYSHFQHQDGIGRRKHPSASSPTPAGLFQPEKLGLRPCPLDPTPGIVTLAKGFLQDIPKM